MLTPGGLAQSVPLATSPQIAAEDWPRPCAPLYGILPRKIAQENRAIVFDACLIRQPPYLRPRTDRPECHGGGERDTTRPRRGEIPGVSRSLDPLLHDAPADLPGLIRRLPTTSGRRPIPGSWTCPVPNRHQPGSLVVALRHVPVSPRGWDGGDDVRTTTVPAMKSCSARRFSLKRRTSSSLHIQTCRATSKVPARGARSARSRA